LINEYFALEKKKIEDSIPKIIMHSLINYMKENARCELDGHLNVNENLLEEAEGVGEMRKEAELKMEKLREAKKIIDTVCYNAV
jgi:hypothetical protein